MNVIIDGIEYQPVEQKVDQEREDAIDAMLDEKNGMAGMHTNRYLCESLYDAGYRRVGEEVSQEELEKFRAVRKGLSYINVIDELRIQYSITKKVAK